MWNLSGSKMKGDTGSNRAFHNFYLHVYESFFGIFGILFDFIANHWKLKLFNVTSITGNNREITAYIWLWLWEECSPRDMLPSSNLTFFFLWIRHWKQRRLFCSGRLSSANAATVAGQATRKSLSHTLRQSNSKNMVNGHFACEVTGAWERATLSRTQSRLPRAMAGKNMIYLTWSINSDVFIISCTFRLEEAVHSLTGKHSTTKRTEQLPFFTGHQR